MGLQTLGLLRESNFEDINNPEIALGNLLTSLANGETYTRDDLLFLRNISQISQSTVDGTYYSDAFLSLDNQLKKLVDIIPLTEDLTPITPIPTIRNRFEAFNLTMGVPRFRGGNGLTRRTYKWSSVYTSTTSLPTTFNNSVFTNKEPIQTNVFWGRGNISFSTELMSPYLDTVEGIQTFTGFFKPTRSGAYSFNISETTTGGVVIELTNNKGANMITSPAYFVPNFSAPSNFTITTQPLEKYKFYNIKIYFLRSPESVKSAPTHNATIKLIHPGTATTSEVFYYDFLYDENYLSNTGGELTDFYDNKLPLGGTDFHNYTNKVESFAIGGSGASDYRGLYTTKTLTINYKPPAFYSSVVTTKTGSLTAGKNYILDIDDTSNIKVGDLVLNSSKNLSAFTYVKEIIDDTSIFLTKDIPVTALSDTLFFIDHKGLKGYTQDYTVITAPTPAFSASNYKGELFKPKDVILHQDTDESVYTTIAAISTNGSIIISGSNLLEPPQSNTPLLFYYRSGVRNLALDGYCAASNVLQLVSMTTTEYAEPDTSILTVDSNNIFDYAGNKIDITTLATTNAAQSAFKVNYDVSIPQDTYITAASLIDNTITLSKSLALPIRAGSALNLSLSTPSKPADNIPRYQCFPPGEVSAPFDITPLGLATPPMTGIDIGNKMISFKEFIFSDKGATSNVAIAPPSRVVNALIPVKDKNNMTLFLIASTTPGS